MHCRKLFRKLWLAVKGFAFRYELERKRSKGAINFALRVAALSGCCCCLAVRLALKSKDVTKVSKDFAKVSKVQRSAFFGSFKSMPHAAAHVHAPRAHDSKLSIAASALGRQVPCHVPCAIAHGSWMRGKSINH